MSRFLSAIMTGLVLALAAASAPATASPGPEERMEDPQLEARARTLYDQLRCVVCQSQSIDDSNAPLAADLRAVVRERLLAGDSNAEVKAYLQERYGDYVLMLPPVQGNTLALWLLPLIVLAGGGTAIVLFVRSQKRRAASDADAADDDARAARLSDDEGLS
ncbi:MAG: cytochrome c-type biogenesis protein [Pseudomonadota bacterium]|nr:cytochrome c-type biogenesis protein [Pseudomonadota bacterium]